MHQLSLPNDINPGPSSLLIATDALPSKTSGPVLKIEQQSAATAPPYTLTQLVRLPDAELHRYLEDVEAKCVRGEDIDTDLWLIRRTQEVLRRMDNQYEVWMQDKRTEMYALLEQLKHIRARIRDEIGHEYHVEGIERYIEKAYTELTELNRQQEENSQRVQALIRCEGFCYRHYARKWPLPHIRLDEF